MRKMLLVGAAVIALGMLGGSRMYVSAAGCGIQPIKPIPPIGCKDLKPSCVCDSKGDKCHWEWVCVPN